MRKKIDFSKLSKKLSKMTNNVHLLIIKQLITRINNGDVDFFTTYKHLDLFCKDFQVHQNEVDMEEVVKQNQNKIVNLLSQTNQLRQRNQNITSQIQSNQNNNSNKATSSSPISNKRKETETNFNEDLPPKKKNYH